MEIEIREAYGEWAVDMETPDQTQSIYFKSRQNALSFVKYLELADNVIELDKKELQAPMTNYDRIKAMNIDEMADALFAFKEECNKDCPIGKNRKYCYMLCDSASAIKEWLEQEVSE